MKRWDVIVAGFGGQGVLLIGKLIAHAALDEGREVCWLPSYGPEMRGGTANCTVVIADDPIGSPVVDRPRGVVAMNRPSLEKFEGRVQSGGFILLNSSMIDTEPSRTDVTVLKVPASEMAIELGSAKAANMVILGAYVALSEVVPFEAMRRTVAHQFADKPDSVEINIRALRAGYDRAIEGKPGGNDADG